MELLPQDIVDIIYDYKHGAEHYDLFMSVRQQVVHYYWMTRKILLNYQFRTIFFPDFFSTLPEFNVLPITDEGDEDEEA